MLQGFFVMKFSMLIRYLLLGVVLLALTGCAGESDTVPVVLDEVIDMGTYEVSDISGTEVTSDSVTELPSNPVSPAVTNNTNTTGVATLSWLPPTENTDNTVLTDLSGYKIYYGESPNSLSNTIVINNIGLTTYVIENLNTNTRYYFAITAINHSNIESVHSNIESKYISG